MRRAAIIVLDGLGIGPAPDSASYGDTGSNTLGNVARAVGGLALPNLQAMGLGCCAPVAGVAEVPAPSAAFGIAIPVSAGKDSTTGHWELCGVTLERPFVVYPEGFPESLLAEFSRRTGRGVIGNRAASGTEIIKELGARHLASGEWIVYTSADSVFQVAAHEGKVPLEELYAACAAAREMLRGEQAVARVIARPFIGAPGSFTRTGNRRDFSLAPPGETLLDRLAAAGIPRHGVGKVDDLFAGRNLTSRHAPTNPEAYREIITALTEMTAGLLLANVIEFDQTWGHRNDVPGFHRGLVELDRVVPELLAPMQGEDLIIFTADHGNDPTTPSTDHSREVVPVLALGSRIRPAALGVRRTFADVGQTVAEYLGVAPLACGTSFLRDLLHG
ncbi:MAG TPA: phosphopentomutase [Gemmatimonadales bacterium]|nr:phosphopentomutase [Gemmatimonadales bacterium]